MRKCPRNSSIKRANNFWNSCWIRRDYERQYDVSDATWNNEHEHSCQSVKHSHQGRVEAEVASNAGTNTGQHAIVPGSHEYSGKRRIGPSRPVRRPRTLFGRRGKPATAVLTLDRLLLNLFSTIRTFFHYVPPFQEDLIAISLGDTAVDYSSRIAPHF